MKKRKVRITNTGYLPNSPDKHNDMNIIPSNQITMKKVPFPILGIDNMGNRQMMMPGGEYSFPGQYVTEIPMGKYQKGKQVKQRKVVYTDPEEFKIANQAYTDSLGVYNAPETSYKRFQDINNLIDNNKFEEAKKLIAQEPPYEKHFRRLTILNNREPEHISGLDHHLGGDPKDPNVPKYKKPETIPVLEELTHIEPRPISKLPVSIPQLIPVDYSSYSKPRTIESFDSNYTQRSGQLKKGDYYYDNALKRWQYKPAEQEEVDYNRSKGAVKKQQGGGIYMGDYEFKDGGLVKYQKRGQVSFDEYMMEGLRPRPAVQESTYRSVPIIEQEKKDRAEGVTTKQKVQAAANRKKIAEEEKKEEIKKQLLEQGEIKPATEGTERLKNQFIYAMDQPLDAMGSLMQRGYVPQGNLNGDYETASPMSSVIGAFNPASVIMDVGRVGRDAFEKETYTTWGGAGEAGLNVAGFLPFGSIAQKSKRLLPINPSQEDLKDLYRNRLANVFSDNITEEQARTLERRVLDSNPNTQSIKQNQQKLFDEATEFQDLWTYNKEGKKQVDDYLKPTFDALNAEQHAIVNKREDLKKGLLEERSKIDAALSDPKNFNDFDKLNQRYNEIEKELQEVKNMGRDRFFEINSLLEDLDSEMRSAVYDKDFKRKAQFLIDAGKSSRDPKFNHDLFYTMDLEPFDKSRTRLVYLDETDPSFMSLSDESKEYLRNNYERIGGVRRSDATITLGSKDFPHTSSYIVKEKLPRSITNPFKSKTKDVILDVKNTSFQDVDEVGGVNAHEIRHDTQRIGKWIDTISKYDDDLQYYVSHEDNPVAKEFKDALVEPGLPKSYETWKAAPIEFDAELSKARFKAAKEVMKEYGLSMEDAIKVLKEDRDDYTDYLIEIGDLNKHFKPGTTQEEKRRLIKMLPAVVPAIGAGYVGSQLYNNQQQEPTYRQGGMYLGKYEFKDGGLVKIQNELDTYANGGKIVSELWVEKTGLPWSAAKQMGLSDGSYDRNIQLREELVRGQYDNLNKNPKARTVQQRTTPIKQVVKPAPQVSRKPETVSKPLSTKYGVYNWSQNLPQKNKQDQGQQVFDKEFSTTTRGTLPELKQDPSYKFPTFAEFQEQKRRSVLTATQPRSTSGTLPTKNENSEVPKKDQAYYDLLNSSKIEFNADAESTARTFNRPISPDSLERNKNIQDLLLKDEVAKSQRTTLTAGEPSLFDKMTEAFNDVKESAGEAYEYAAQELADYKESATKKLEEYGILTPSTEGNLVKFEQPKQQVQPKDSVNYYIPPTQVTEDNNADYGEADNKFWGFRYQNSNDSGLVYVPTPRREKLNKDSKFSNVKGVAHFLIQTDATDGFIDPGTKWQLDKDLKSNKYVPFIKKEADGKVRLKYAKGSNEYKNFAEEGYEPFTTLRTLNLSDIDWNKTARPYHNVQAAQADEYKRTGKGMFGKGISNVLTKDGKDTWLVFKDATGKGNKLGQFNGGALVFIIETPNGRVIRDFTGTIQDIENESKNIVKEFKVPAKNVTLGFYDAGSYTAKPKANENNELYFNQYSGFNKADKLSGAALMIPANLEQGGQTLKGYSKGGNTTTQGIYLGKYEFKDGGLVKAQRGLNRRMVRQYPGMKSVYGDRGENLNVIKDKNFIPSEYGYGDIEFMYPGDGLVTYNDEYAYQSPTPDKYTAVYNPKGANKHDVFLDMMHGMRHDPDYMELLNEFETATRNARGADMKHFFDQDAQEDPNFVIDGREQWDKNYIDGMVRAHMYKLASQEKHLPFVNPFGSKPHGTEDYEMELGPNSPEMYQAADQIYNYIKGDKRKDSTSLKKVKIKRAPRKNQ